VQLPIIIKYLTLTLHKHKKHGHSDSDSHFLSHKVSVMTNLCKKKNYGSHTVLFLDRLKVEENSKFTLLFSKRTKNNS